MAKQPKPLSDDAPPQLPPAPPTGGGKKQAQEKLPADSILIEGIGPIRRAIITAPPGAVTVLSGKNGAGKTMAVDAVRALAGGKVRLPKSDNAEVGTVTGLGVNIRVTASGRNTRNGELICDSIESDVSIGKMIDPGIDDPVAADAVRIREVVTLLDLEVGPDQVYPLLGGPALWKRYCGHIEDNLPTVEFINRVKSALQSAARTEERDADTYTGEANAIRGELDRIPKSDMTVEQAQQRQQDAVAHKTRLEEQKRQADEQAEARKNAAGVATAGRSVAECTQALMDAEVARDGITTQITELEKQLAALREKFTSANTAVTSARQALADSEANTKALADMRAIVDAATITAPTEDELVAATSAVTVANSAAAGASRAQERIAVEQRLTAKEQLATEAGDRANRLRHAADQLPTLLANAIREAQVPSLDITTDMRLVVTDHARGRVPVGELSHGERAGLALRLVACACSNTGAEPLVGLEQEAWESLDGAAQAEVIENVAALNMRFVTAEADRENPPSKEMTVKTLRPE